MGQQTKPRQGGLVCWFRQGVKPRQGVKGRETNGTTKTLIESVKHLI